MRWTLRTVPPGEALALQWHDVLLEPASGARFGSRHVRLPALAAGSSGISTSGDRLPPLAVFTIGGQQAPAWKVLKLGKVFVVRSLRHTFYLLRIVPKPLIIVQVCSIPCGVNRAGSNRHRIWDSIEPISPGSFRSLTLLRRLCHQKQAVRPSPLDRAVAQSSTARNLQ